MLQCGTPISDFPLIMYIFEFIRIYVCISCTCIYIYTAVYLSLYIYVHTCVYIYIHIYIYVHVRRVHQQNSEGTKLPFDLKPMRISQQASHPFLFRGLSTNHREMKVQIPARRR